MRNILAVVALVSASFAHAGETRFFADPTQDLASLERSGKVVVQTARQGKRFNLDAVARRARRLLARTLRTDEDAGAAPRLFDTEE